MAEVLLNQKITTRVLLRSTPFILWLCQSFLFCMGYPEELCWTLLDIPIYASTTQKVICSFELSLFSYFLALVCQLIVRSMCAFVHRCLLLLWPVKSFYSGMTRRNKTPVPHPYLGLGQSNCIPQIKLPIQPLICSTLKYYPLYVRNVMRIAPSLMNSWYSDTSRHHYSFLGSVLSQPERRQVNRDVWNLYS
jgi:hypothetical protein